MRPTVSDTEISYWIVEWDDGTYSIVNDNYTRILSYHPFGLYWDTYSYGATIQDSQKWNLYKMNNIKCDANVDGYISFSDVQYIQQSLASVITLNNTEKYLADLDHDGIISVIDSTLAYMVLDNNVFY